ncbi:hypothetical protein HB779_12110 [Phyllobacterium sp. 628]|uniref:hypothetical protein n=1 Tax=Phyllobacterium sp. 628 TaxID=2718938 RepID=UPI0016622D8E|nr:hypothetical protein [Phyllobacterium sp. 628]QND52562.1 hypothetical protein HB779_12110 [Phyllobacterium sp. 628]
MLDDRLSYGDFRRYLLFWFAVMVEGDLDRPRRPKNALTLITGRYHPSWTLPGAKRLCDQHLLVEQLQQRSSILNDGADIFYSLTEAGLEEAESWGRLNNLDLYVEIDKLISSNEPLDVGNAFHQEDEHVITLDRSTSDFREVEKSLGGVDKVAHPQAD